MKKPSKKQPPRLVSRKKSFKFAKQIPRSWDLAARLEHRRVKGKGSSK